MRSPFRSGKIALLIVGALLVLASILYFVFVGKSEPVAPPTAGKEIAEPFLNQVRAGEIDKAWEGTTAEFKSIMGREFFREFVRDHPVFQQPLEFAELKPIVTQGLTRTECTFRQPGAPAAKPVIVLLAKENDAWKVEYVRVD